MLHMRCLVIMLLLGFGAIASANAQIVALGASSTAGYGVGAAAAYPAQLEAILRAKGRPMSVSAAGVSGDRGRPPPRGGAARRIAPLNGTGRPPPHRGR